MRKSLLVAIGILVVLIVIYFVATPDYWDLVEANTNCVNQYDGDVFAGQEHCTRQYQEMSKWEFYLRYNAWW